MYTEAVPHVGCEGHLDPAVRRGALNKCRSTMLCDLRGATSGTKQHTFKGVTSILKQQQNGLLITNSLLCRTSSTGLAMRACHLLCFAQMHIKDPYGCEQERKGPHLGGSGWQTA